MHRTSARAVSLWCLLQAVLLALLLLAGPTAADGVTAHKRSAAGKYSKQAETATNSHRVDEGLVRLKRKKCVQRYAVKQAKRMASQRRMFHQELGPILSECGLSSVGENVAYGFKSGRSVVNHGWMRSAGHRANILNPGYRLMGIGARRGSDGYWYVAQVFGRKG